MNSPEDVYKALLEINTIKDQYNERSKRTKILRKNGLPHRKLWENVFGNYTPDTNLEDIRRLYEHYEDKYYARLKGNPYVPRANTKKIANFKNLIDKGLKNANKNVRLQPLKFVNPHTVQPKLKNRVLKGAYEWGRSLSKVGGWLSLGVPVDFFFHSLEIFNDYSKLYGLYVARLGLAGGVGFVLWVFAKLLTYLFGHKRYRAKLEQMQRDYQEIQQLMAYRKTSRTPTVENDDFKLRSIDDRIVHLKKKLSTNADSLFRLAYQQGKLNIGNFKEEFQREFQNLNYQAINAKRNAPTNVNIASPQTKTLRNRVVTWIPTAKAVTPWIPTARWR